MCNINFLSAKILFVFIIILVLSGCTLTYPVVGTYTDYKEIYSGTVEANLINGSSWIQIAGKTSKTQCKGMSTVTHIPAISYVLPICSGQRGAAMLNCNDSRVIDAQWEAISCSSGVGSGSDKMGNRFIFVFGGKEEVNNKYINNVVGMNEEDAIKYIKQGMKDAAIQQNHLDEGQ